MIHESELALNVGLWRKKPGESGQQVRAKAVHDLASAALEQRVGNPEDQINPVILLVLADGDFFDPNSLKRLSDGLRWKTATDLAENEAYFRICDWARENNSGFLIWISPPREVYSRSRFTLYQIVADDQQKMVRLWGICGKQTAEECLRIANAIREGEGTVFNNPEELRSQPILVRSPRGVGAFDFLSLYIDPLEVWEKIKKGAVFKEKQRTLAAAEKVIQRMQTRIEAAKTQYERILVGAEVEMAMQQELGIAFQSYGSCGMSNQAALGEEKEGIFGLLFKETTKKGAWVEQCPFCRTSIRRVMYPKDKCPGCGREFPGVC